MSAAEQSTEKPLPNQNDAAAIAGRIEGLDKTNQDLSVELNKDNTLFHAQGNAQLAKEVQAKLTSDGFPAFEVSKNGDLVSTATKTGSSTADAAPPSQSDFVNFANMVADKIKAGGPALSSGMNIEAKDFAGTFGDKDAQILNRLGLASIELQNNHIQASFNKPGDVAFGSDPLSYDTTVKMDYSTVNGSEHFANISGLKGKDSGFSANVASIDISPPDANTGLTDVKAVGKLGFISKTLDEKVAVENTASNQPIS